MDYVYKGETFTLDMDDHCIRLHFPKLNLYSWVGVSSTGTRDTPYAWTCYHSHVDMHRCIKAARRTSSIEQAVHEACDAVLTGFEGEINRTDARNEIHRWFNEGQKVVA